MSRSKDPEQLAKEAAATQPSRTLKILAALRGESASDALAGHDDENDPELLPYGAGVEGPGGLEQPGPDADTDPDVPPLSPSEQSRVARFRARAGAYRGSSPTTRR